MNSNGTCCDGCKTWFSFEDWYRKENFCTNEFIWLCADCMKGSGYID